MTTAQFERSSILRRDVGRVGSSLDRLADQFSDGWSQAKRVKVPASYRAIDRIALCGMGGSHLGADILRSVLADQLTVPMTIVADYVLPAWVNSRTLVICSSYSGTTEETLTALKTARKRKAKIVVVTSGGTLVSEAKKLNLPLYQYQPTENPSGQPRLGVAYGMMAMLMCWKKLGLASVSDDEVAAMSTAAWKATKRWRLSVPAQRNAAKQLAMSWQGKMPFLIGAEWTAGNLHSLVNQIHENAKTYADFRLLPDLNHHLLEGLRNRAVTKQMSVLMITDRAYLKRNQIRMHLTTKILQQHGATVTMWSPRSKTSLAKAAELLAFGSYVSWYFAAVRNMEPSTIPTVNFLKAQLAKR